MSTILRLSSGQRRRLKLVPEPFEFEQLKPSLELDLKSLSTLGLQVLQEVS